MLIWIVSWLLAPLGPILFLLLLWCNWGCCCRWQRCQWCQWGRFRQSGNVLSIVDTDEFRDGIDVANLRWAQACRWHFWCWCWPCWNISRCCVSPLCCCSSCCDGSGLFPQLVMLTSALSNSNRLLCVCCRDEHDEHSCARPLVDDFLSMSLTRCFCTRFHHSYDDVNCCAIGHVVGVVFHKKHDMLLVDALVEDGVVLLVHFDVLDDNVESISCYRICCRIVESISCNRTCSQIVESISCSRSCCRVHESISCRRSCRQIVESIFLIEFVVVDVVVQLVIFSLLSLLWCNLSCLSSLFSSLFSCNISFLIVDPFFVGAPWRCPFRMLRPLN